MYNLVLRQLEDLGNVLGYIKYSALLLRANVVNLPNDTLMQDTRKGFCDILHIQITPGCNSCKWHKERCITPTQD